MSEELEQNQNTPEESNLYRKYSETEVVADLYMKIKAEISKIIVGQDEAIDFAVIALLTGGHVLLEGVPGIAKTLTAKMLAKVVSADFKRIQFTPDLMPSDILGASVFNMKTAEFNFHKGPIFSNIILIDEINRSPAKTQAALFESMEETQVSIEGNLFKLSEPFFVMATQNPVEQEGTYKLPEAQLDRFLFRIILNYPSLEEEVLILNRFKEDFYKENLGSVQQVCSVADIANCKKIIEKVYIKNDLIKYIAQIVFETRNNSNLYLGASPRASMAILKASKAQAAISGRDFVTPDDISRVAFNVLNHRIIMQPEKEMEGVEPAEVIAEIIKSIEIPR
jgi:MoxR-like ATPase